MSDNAQQPNLERRPWGRVGDDEVSLFTLRTREGVVARISDFGAALVALELPTLGGEAVDVMLGFDRVTGPEGTAYAGTQPYLGAVVGRVANRIARSRFVLDGAVVSLAANEGAHHLHGGPTGFHHRLWGVQPLRHGETPGLSLSYLSADHEEGYPGRLWASAVYRLGPGPVLRLDLRAVSDAPTPVSLTHHPYVNLAGHASGSVLDHELTLYCAHMTPTDEDGIPTGEVREVHGTPFDFRTAKPLGRDLGAPALGGGYDVNFVVDGPVGRLRPAARLREPLSGRELEVWTTQPGLQVYTGDGLDGTVVGKGGAAYRRHAGVALEAQAFPNAVNTPHFPSVLLRPGEVYRQTIEYRFRGVSPRSRQG